MPKIEFAANTIASPQQQDAFSKPCRETSAQGQRRFLLVEPARFAMGAPLRMLEPIKALLSPQLQLFPHPQP